MIYLYSWKTKLNIFVLLQTPFPITISTIQLTSSGPACPAAQRRITEHVFWKGGIGIYDHARTSSPIRPPLSLPPMRQPQTTHQFWPDLPYFATWNNRTYLLKRWHWNRWSRPPLRPNGRRPCPRQGVTSGRLLPHQQQRWQWRMIETCDIKIYSSINTLLNSFMIEHRKFFFHIVAVFA